MTKVSYKKIMEDEILAAVGGISDVAKNWIINGLFKSYFNLVYIIPAQMYIHYLEIDQHFYFQY